MSSNSPGGPIGPKDLFEAYKVTSEFVSRFNDRVFEALEKNDKSLEEFIGYGTCPEISEEQSLADRMMMVPLVGALMSTSSTTKIHEFRSRCYAFSATDQFNQKGAYLIDEKMKRIRQLDEQRRTTRVYRLAFTAGSFIVLPKSYIVGALLVEFSLATIQGHHARKLDARIAKNMVSYSKKNN